MRQLILWRTLALMMSLLPLLSCTDDEFGDMNDDVFYNLTSVTWFDENYGVLPDRREFSEFNYWDFYTDGTGVWEYYYQEDGYDMQQQRYYFDWEFTPEDFGIIHLYIQGVGDEFWMIDELTPYRFSSYVSQDDPNYVADPPYVYQSLKALIE